VTRPPLASPSAPRGRLPLARPRWGLQAWLPLIAHVLVVVAVIWRGHALVERGGGQGEGSRGGGGRERVQFFTLPAAPPMTAFELPAVPRVALSYLPSVDVRLELTRMDLTPPLVAMPSQVLTGGGPGTGGGRGGGAGPGTGAAVGPGTGGEKGYIFPPDPRGAILPPMDGVPRAVRGRPHRVTWWVAADGRIERVDVRPEIADEKYRRDFYERMRSYKFEPARTRDGRRVPGVVTLTITP
jgi:hypothetical protein